MQIGLAEKDGEYYNEIKGIVDVVLEQIGATSDKTKALVILGMHLTDKLVVKAVFSNLTTLYIIPDENVFYAMDEHSSPIDVNEFLIKWAEGLTEYKAEEIKKEYEQRQRQSIIDSLSQN